MSVKVDTQGDLWISPYGKGLDRYIDGGRKQTHYDVSNSDLTNNVILDIEERDVLYGWLPMAVESVS